MAIIVLYPAVAMLAMFIMLVIMLILRFGHRCRLRHTTLPEYDQYDFKEDEVYEQDNMSYA